MKTCQKCGTQYDEAMSFCLRDGEVLGDGEARMTGRILDGQYEIEAFIARGGMGSIYRARHTLLGDRVAIKILPPEMRQNSEWLKRFQREGQAARRFHHPNSVIVHDLRTSSEGEVYLVMEYVEGRTLDKELAARGGRLAPPEILRLVEPVASVLDAAHQMNVVHRDLKPSNIMITERGQVKVLDLGIAKLSDMEGADARLTYAGQLLGTPYYMSPEQWGEMQRDGRLEVDGRADVYSLGVVVYEMTVGRRPFDAASAIELRHAHCRLQPRLPAESNLHLPPGWTSAVLRALSKDRSDRQASAGEFVRELRAGLGVAPAGGDSEARAHAPTVINPLVQTDLTPALETPSNLNRGTMQPPAPSATYPQPQQAAPFPMAGGPAPGLGHTPENSRSSLVLGSIILLALLAAVAGAYGIWRWKTTRQGERAPTAARDSNQPARDGGGPATGVNRKDVSADEAFMRYHLLLGASLLDAQQRATGRDPVKAGASVQMVLKAREAGYLYMMGQDTEGHPVVMPVNVFDPELEVAANQEVTVPPLAFITLNKDADTDNFTVIFARERLRLPFVSETLPLDGTFRKLTTEEQEQIEELRRQAPPVQIEYTDRDGGEALVRLAGQPGAGPVVFDITLTLEP